MFKLFKMWTIRKKLMAWCLLVSLLPMLVITIVNLGFQARNMRESIGDRLIDNRQGLDIALKEEAIQFLEQTLRAAAQPFLLGAVSIKNMAALDQLLASYLRLTQADLYGVFDRAGQPLLVLQIDKTNGANPSLAAPREGNSASDPAAPTDFERKPSSEKELIGLAKEKASPEDDLLPNNLAFPDEGEGEAAPNKASSILTKGIFEKIVRVDAEPLSEDLMARLSFGRRAVTRTAQVDGILRSSHVALEFGGRKIGSLWQGILLDQAFVERLKKRTGLDVALIHPDGYSIASTLSNLKDLLTENDIGEIKEVNISEQLYLYTFLPFGNAKGKKEGGIALLQSLEDFQREQRKLLGFSLLAFGLIAVAVILMSSFVSNSFSRPLRLLMTTANEIAAGNFKQRVAISSRDEIGQLGRSFNHMTDSLRSSMAALISTQEYTENILKSMLNALIVVSPQGTIQQVNKAACVLLAYREEDLVGKAVGSIFDEDSDSAFQIGKTNLIAYLQRKERHLITKMGKKIPVLFTGSVMHDPAGEIEGIVCLAQDISDQKKAEAELRAYSEKLQQSNRELRDFAHIASHDLQEPLRKIFVFGTRLKEKNGKALNEQGKNDLNRILNGIHRMQTLINDLLAFSFLTQNVNRYVPVDLFKIVHEVLNDLAGKIRETGGSVEVGNLPTIEAEPVHMRQLFQHLIDNALKFRRMDEAPLVRIRSEVMLGRGKHASFGNLLKIVIEDNGIGFDPKYNDRIFTVFQRLHDRTVYEGNGVGLALCRKIAEQHGGSITALSAAGQGAAFIVWLPLKQLSTGGI